MYLHPPDVAVAESLRRVAAKWGGSFEVLPVTNWRTIVREHPGGVVHLTMYGLDLERLLPRLRRESSLLFVVGGAKVPPELYRLADFNVAVGGQPHSEVAALAVALERVLGPPRRGSARGARLRIVPSARGKRVRVREQGSR
jgi:tRNA (cytidine56-2'-O)-methyltransferase